MKTKELIRQLQDLDPTGEVEVTAPDGDIYFLEMVEAYWDGSLNVLIRDPALAPFYDVVGMREIRSGTKIRIHCLSLYDVVENGHGDKFEELKIEGRPEFIHRARQYHAEHEELYNRIECDAFEKFCLEVLDFQNHDAITKFFYGNPHLFRAFRMGERSISKQRRAYWTDCVKVVGGHLTYITGFEEKAYSLAPQ